MAGMDNNPYAVTTSLQMDPRLEANVDAEHVRRTNLSHEASIKSVGFLYILGSIFSILYGALTLSVGLGSWLMRGSAISAEGAKAIGPSEISIGAFIAAVGTLQFYAGWSLRSLNATGKPVAIGIACLGLLGIPIGTLISAYILYLLLSEKGKIVFSPEYRAIIAATPHIRYRTSIVVWIFLILLIALILMGIIGFAISNLGSP